jgi:S-adenosylmethionine hydrolase
MALITFTSDFGLSDHYLGQIKGTFLSTNSNQRIIDISHQIQAYDITHMAFVIESVFKDFPEGTVHFIGMDDEQGYMIAWVEGHYFVVPNNGVISLVSTRRPDLMIDIKAEKHLLKTAAKVAVKLANGEAPETFGQPLTQYKEYSQRKSRATKKEIAGHVIRVDHFGNLITNIEWTDFSILSKERKYTLHFGREKLTEINQLKSQVEPGDIFAQFSDHEKLVIGIYQGNGAQLLGLSFDSPITIIFEEG